MLNVHIVAASLAAAQPAAAPPPETPVQEAPAEAASEVLPEVLPEPLPEPSPEPLPESPSTPSAETAPAADDIDLDPIAEDNDPLEGFNRVSFDVSQAFDKVFIRPAALAYRKVIPSLLRDGVRNTIRNAQEPLVAVNDLLQLKPKRAFRTVGRFFINTILGLGGLFDIAKRKQFNLPHHGNSLGSTLGVYGVKPGPYIYLPVLGPATLRDQVDRFQGRPFPQAFNDPLDAIGAGLAPLVLDGLDQRERNDDELRTLLDDAVDKYATFRSTWLQDRQAAIDALKAPDAQPPGPVDAPAEPAAEPELVEAP